ncbi:hypothetical protein HHK36_012124 [Tetracentron sinense]|uniref:Uncharacterized protein n=1 Tax=Tetracentron sinense TaxID=13715 RepID=A0A835DEA8_TETSI|nr:hypothetical protein HHK36_012124 [Tetracentron sinense]
MPALPTVQKVGVVPKLSEKNEGDGEKEELVLQDTFAQETAVMVEDPNIEVVYRRVRDFRFRHRFSSLAENRKWPELRVGNSLNGKASSRQQSPAMANQGVTLEMNQQRSLRQGSVPLYLNLEQSVGCSSIQWKEQEKVGGNSRRGRAGSDGDRVEFSNRCFRKVYRRRVRSNGGGSSGVGFPSDQCGPRLKSLVIKPNISNISGGSDFSKVMRNSRGRLCFLRRNSSDDSLGYNSETLFKLRPRGSSLLVMDSVDQSWAVEEVLPGQAGAVESLADITAEDKLNQLVSVVRTTKEKERSTPMEVGDGLVERDNQFSDSEISREGSSDEEGLWRMQGAEFEGEDDHGAELEKCDTDSNETVAEVGSLMRREILANVDRSVEVSKVLGLRFAGGRIRREFFSRIWN